MSYGIPKPPFRLQALASAVLPRALLALLGLGLAACSSLPQKPQTPVSSKPSVNSAPAASTKQYQPIPLMNPAETVTVFPNLDADDEAVAELEPVSVQAEDLARFGDVWERMRHGFKMDLTQDNDRIAAQRNWFLQRQDFMNRVSDRASRYLFHTVTDAEKYGVPSELALLPVIESSYNPFALSHASAAGIWQFIPSTGQIFGLKQNWWYDGRRDVTESTRAAYEFLGKLYSKFGDWQLALAAYNAGPGTVQRAINQNAAEGLPTDFWSLRLPSETMSYVPRFLAVAQIVQDPARYGISITPVVNQAHFRAVTTNSQIDLAKAAELAGISLKELQALNPGYSRWATHPEGPHRLLVPINTAADFESQLSTLPPPERIAVQHYRVKRGDTLFKVAKRHGIAAAELKRLNKLKRNKLQAGQMLVISKSRASSEAYSLSQDQRQARSQSQDSAPRRSYRIKSGDTLYAIARSQGVSPKQLADWNNLSMNSALRPGQRLQIQSKGRSESNRVASRSANKVQRIRYEVRKGDTLFKIANRYKVSVSQIKNWNSSSHRIKPGQDLVIYIASNSSGRGRDL